MPVEVKLSPEVERELAENIARFYADPYGWVMFSYPWGQPLLPDGSPNPLAKKKGPEAWQKKALLAIGKHIRGNIQMKAWELDYLVWRSAIASGHGVGKSAFVAWMIQFLMSTRRDTRLAVTANTANQLETKTWPELAKWHKLLINRHWFEWTSTTYYFKQYPEDQRKNYMANALTVSEDNTEAFAGLHNETGTVGVIFDEASGIFAKLWEVAMGALTDGEGFFFAFGNPTNPEGEFADCFDKHREMYYTAHVDSRDVSHTNKAALADIIRRYGEDSDEVKVRIKGIFPAQAYNGFIGRETLQVALEREVIYDPGAPIIMAIDGARYGPDKNVIRVRQGRDARSRPPIVIPGRLSNTRLAQIIAIEADKIKPDAIVMESVGPTVGVIDILRDRGYKVVEVHPGAPSSEPMIYDRVRDEIWHLMRDWIVDEGCLPDEPLLVEQLSKIQYFVDTKTQKTKIERKEDYCERTRLPSPDEADSLALTFAVRIARRDRNLDAHRRGQNGGDIAVHEYDLFNH
jgi:hypothetical protein